MNSLGRENRRQYASETETSNSNSTTTQPQPFHSQGQSETQIPFVLNTASLPHVITPATPFVLGPEQPAPWQLGRHSQYVPDTIHGQQPSNLNGQHALGHAVEDHRLDPEYVIHQVSGYNEAEKSNVEKDLHRGLQARQVRLLSVPNPC